MSGPFAYSNRLMISTALIALSLIGYQLAIIQLLSYTQWYHYANMVISIALLGFGTAGTLLSLMRLRILQHANLLLPLLMMLSGISMTASVWLSQGRFANFDSYLLLVDRAQWLALLINYLLFLLPYFFGGLALGIIFVRSVKEIGRLYFFDLTGSSVGAITAAALAWYFLPASLPALMGLIATTAGLLLLANKKRVVLAVIAVISIVFSMYSIARPVAPRISQYKSLSRTLNLPAAKVILSKPAPYGYVEVVSAEALRYAPGLSLGFTGEIPVRKVIFNNGDWYGQVAGWKPSDSAHLLDYSTIGLPYAIGKRSNALLLYAGTGLAASQALSNGCTAIDVAEPHEGITSLLVGDLAVENDSLFYRKQVKLHVIEPRTFLSITKQRYDLIALPLIGSFGGNSGLYAMREEYSLTKEAFHAMRRLLTTDGVISVTAWMDYPFRNTLKLAATLNEVAEEAGVKNPAAYMVAIRSWSTVTFLLKRTPFKHAEITALKAFCEKNSFDPLIFSGLDKNERMKYNLINDPSFFNYIDDLFSGRKEKVYSAYDFHLKPATDDHPYFSQFLRWKSLPHLASIFGEQSVSFLELGWIISILTFIQSTLLALLLIILPLFKRGWKGGRKGWTILYFSGLGIGYMFLEMIFIQKFILFFGNPVYAVSFVIAVMLLSSGAGSFFSSGLMSVRYLMQRVLLGIFVVLVVYIFFLSYLLQQIMSASFIVKGVVSVLIISIPAFLMGMPFPLGLNALSALEEKHIPWAWGINGSMSVIGAALGTLLAVEVGFSTVMMLAAFAYLLSLLAMFWYPRRVG
jgi:hypothetical protein